MYSLMFSATMWEFFLLRKWFWVISAPGMTSRAYSRFARSAYDLALAYDAMQGYDPEDPVCVDRPAEPTAPRPAPVSSVLGSDLLIKGGIEGRGSVQLHGRAWGDVKVERLLVTETAELEGSIEAVVVEVRGRVLGPISARYVKLARGCTVQGDVTYESLAIEEGASIEGSCKLSKAASKPSWPACKPRSAPVGKLPCDRPQKHVLLN